MVEMVRYDRAGCGAGGRGSGVVMNSSTDGYG